MPLWSRKDVPKAPAAPPPPAAPTAPPQNQKLNCNFCGKSNLEVKKLIAGTNVYICDECIGLCNDILAEDDAAAAPKLPLAPANASALWEPLERDVVGQPAACRAVGVALFRHLRNISAEQAAGPVRVLLVGPRGCGKTALAKALCRLLPGLPSYHADVSRMSETGYVGENVENIVGSLLSKAIDDETGRRGVLVLDGLHHLVRQQPAENKRDIAGREAQRDLVRVLDGLEIAAVMDAKRHPQAPNHPVLADRMMIVGIASFDAAATDEIALREELVGDGLVDEMVSRFDVIVKLRRLPAADLRVVLDRMLAAERPLFESTGATLQVRDGAELLVERALLSNDGTFALQPAVARLRERVLLEPARAWVLDRALAAELLATR